MTTDRFTKRSQAANKSTCYWTVNKFSSNNKKKMTFPKAPPISNPAASITIFRGRSYRIQIETNPMITIATVINIQRVIGLSCAKSPKFMP